MERPKLENRMSKIQGLKSSSISLDIKLRPIRFAFLVRPDDKRKVHDIFQVNTCLWGGMYNPIIPFFKRVPKWWERKGYRFDNAKQVINGYLDFFEPDFIVEAESGIANGLGFAQKRVLQLSDILVKAGDRNQNGYGLGVLDIYRELYKNEFQFVRRHKHNIVTTKPEQSSFSLFASCVFGGFPNHQALEYVSKSYEEAFDPKIVELNAASLLDLYKTAYTSALDIGSSKIEIHHHDRGDPTLFIFDAHQSKDLVDFWNLRLVERNVLAVPLQWVETLSPLCKDLILKNHHPLPGNPNGVMIHTTLMFSRSIPEEDIEPIYKQHFDTGSQGAAHLQVWYPSIWRPPSDQIHSATRPTLIAKEKNISLQVDQENPEIQFEPLHPDFAERYGNKYRWANVARISAWGDSEKITTTFPCDYKNPLFPKPSIGRGSNLPTNEGVVFFPLHKNLAERWKLTNGVSSFTEWFRGHNISCSQSESGNATQQIIETLGGFWGVSCIAHHGIVSLLNEMSRQPKHSMGTQEFQNKIKNALGKDIWRDRTFETLVERKAVELGVELRCSKCNTRGWHPISRLDEVMSCDLCLKEFNFPITSPNQDCKWSYRVIGPFALQKWAEGGYASALSIRFFASVIDTSMDTGIAWSSGLKLTLPTKESEADFILWYQRKKIFDLNRPTQIVFGEAKSFGKDAFEEKDIERMKILADSFPCSILVFSTMKNHEELSKTEISRLKKLTVWGREYDKERRQTRAPVIILTGTELFAAHNLNQAWEDKGGKHKELISHGWVRTENLRVLADLTQQLYLGLPSYHSWCDAKYARRNSRPT